MPSERGASDTPRLLGLNTDDNVNWISRFRG